MKKYSVQTLMEESKVQHQESLTLVFNKLIEINDRLVELQELIKGAQYKRHGSLTMSLYKCGRGCLGCPHPKWLKWVNLDKPRYSKNAIQNAVQIKDGRVHRFVATYAKYPKKNITHSTAVKDHKAAQYVGEATRLIEQRSRIIKHISQAVREAKVDRT